MNKSILLVLLGVSLICLSVASVAGLLKKPGLKTKVDLSSKAADGLHRAGIIDCPALKVINTWNGKKANKWDLKTIKHARTRCPQIFKGRSPCLVKFVIKLPGPPGLYHAVCGEKVWHGSKPFMYK